ncbi:hypothetical protein M6B38_198440 [Iris pallida]|uniref:Uncharacterized protein n=1 Tax=Iris pallida TaxID=29817 RepID=A0AAX6EBE3_IRIPA|nr:hypothetical protein M6B38_198440 [Iris pallida]
MMMDGTTFYNISIYYEYNLYGISLIPFFASKKKKKKKTMVKLIWLGFSPSKFQWRGSSVAAICWKEG